MSLTHELTVDGSPRRISAMARFAPSMSPGAAPRPSCCAPGPPFWPPYGIRPFATCGRWATSTPWPA